MYLEPSTQKAAASSLINVRVQDDEVLSILSTPSSEASLSTRAVTYPTKVEHVDEAQSLIANVSISGPQSWLTTFTQCVLYEIG